MNADVGYGISRGLDVLSQWLLNRAASIEDEKRYGARRKMEQEDRLLEREQERKWREEDRKAGLAAQGEQRGISEEIIGGQVMKVDRSRTYNAETGQYDEKTYGAIPAESARGPKLRSGGGGAYLYGEELGADGKPVIVPTGYAGTGGRGGAGPKMMGVRMPDGSYKRVSEDDIPQGAVPWTAADGKAPKPTQRGNPPKSWRENIDSGMPIKSTAAGEEGTTGVAYFVEPEGGFSRPGAAAPAEADAGGMQASLAASLEELRSSPVPKSQWEALLLQDGFPPEAIKRALGR